MKYTIVIFFLMSFLLVQSAPLPEQTMQEKAQEAFDRFKDRAQEAIEYAQETAGKAIESARNKLQELMDSAQETAKQGMENGHELIDSGRSYIAGLKNTTEELDKHML
ncbi:uncharacterized protein LOC130675441 [Microplitis mediator]|uniref:uncharacterized protein LOC130675441 n=1 Tax=Microplitis mediator TaxID=375433 RepID=UPI002557C36C|nr:uncharacterized protein LOC130675441 [Microplitis mediator]